jgi:hypothetical protein
MNNAVARTQGNAAAGADEVRQVVVGLDIDRLGVSRSVAERLHDQVGREAQAGQVLEFVTCHGTGGILAAH